MALLPSKPRVTNKCDGFPASSLSWMCPSASPKSEWFSPWPGGRRAEEPTGTSPGPGVRGQVCALSACGHTIVGKSPPLTRPHLPCEGVKEAPRVSNLLCLACILFKLFSEFIANI